MSSNIEIQKYCEHCGNSFTARTTVTRYCGDVCSKRAYKARKRAEKINASIVEVKKVEKKSIEDLKQREFLTVTQVSKLIGCSRQNIYKLIHAGKLKATNILKKKTIIKRSDIDILFVPKTEIQYQEHPIPETKERQFDISECYTIAEVQEKFNVSQTALQNIIKRELVPKKKQGKFVYVPREIIDNIFN
ncbi:helix-turn-helix domain-containing protein [Chryseobacterium nepalense]|uniref:helix-turn-helix domain-containing protein n=1 Tax=Chryseobacterium nepalense TaxID=1854498 RepID=UPI002E0BAB2A|nr:excisionase family DNA binding protein [Chryseobacterium nepalense]